MSDYGFTHEGKVFTPNGMTGINPEENDARNAEAQSAEIAWLKTGPDKVFLYVWLPKEYHTRTYNDRYNSCPLAIVQTWLGTAVTEAFRIGRSVPVGGIAGRYAHKRSVDCRIFGTRYVGWYYESSGNYCRLKKAKVQK
jgi:bacteriorhodopsin